MADNNHLNLSVAEIWSAVERDVKDLQNEGFSIEILSTANIETTADEVDAMEIIDRHDLDLLIYLHATQDGDLNVRLTAPATAPGLSAFLRPASTSLFNFDINLPTVKEHMLLGPWQASGERLEHTIRGILEFAIASSWLSPPTQSLQEALKHLRKSVWKLSNAGASELTEGPLIALGSVQALAGDFADAEETFKSALEIQNSLDAKLGLAETYYWTGRGRCSRDTVDRFVLAKANAYFRAVDADPETNDFQRVRSKLGLLRLLACDALTRSDASALQPLQAILDELARSAEGASK